MAQNRNSFTSLHVFRNYLVDLPDGSTDASRIHSPQCYQAWLKVRGSRHCEQEAKRFQRALTNHLSGVGHHEKESELNQGKQTPPTSTASGSRGDGDDLPEISPELLPSKKRLCVRPWSSSEPATAVTLSPERTAQYTALAHGLQQFHQLFEGFGIDVWRTVMAELRFVIFPIASWLTRVNEAYAAELCERTSKQNPNASVLVVNFSSPEQLVLAQNLLAKRRFGAQVGRFCGDVLQGMSLYMLVLALADACSNRSQRTAHKDGSVTLKIDPVSSLLIVVMSGTC
ncbi:hypothetical protein BASA81_003843 [Batrachochytrium salamandrivorans]|nr:hypothetical protein BASA81_003843 [Batrachochytrium salamandrivorans]